MRILAVTPYSPPEGGGLERYADAMLAQLAAGGHEVHWIATTRHEPGREIRGGLTIDRITVPFHLGNAPIDAHLARRLRAAIQAFHPDVVMGHAPVPFPAEAAARAAKREGVPFVLTYHAGRLRGSTPALEAMACVARATTQRRLFASSARIIAVSQFVQDHALAGHESRTTIIPPGVDERFRPGGPVDPTEILFVGPLSSHYRWKGLDVLWQAFGLLRQRGIEARLRLVGSGDRSHEFQHRAQGREDVQVDVRLSEEDLLAAYQRSGVVVLPSTGDAEAFGMVLAEANACGRPVVGSRVGGIPDFVEDGHNGLLANPGDAEDLAGRIAWLLARPDEMERMGRAGRLKVREFHDWRDLAARTEDVLKEAAQRRRRTARNQPYAAG